MREINKGREPRGLVAYKRTTNACYDDYRDKDALRVVLATEQKGICCYCMARIAATASEMKIEHWRCQANYPGEELNYRNLLGACLGGTGQPIQLQHCDTRKGNSDIRWNPADPAHRIEDRLIYEPDGSIRSNDQTFDTEIHDVLNLNVAHLKNQRKSVYTAVLEWWAGEKARLRGPVPQVVIQRQIDKRQNRNAELSPFVQVAIWLLRKKLRKPTT